MKLSSESTLQINSIYSIRIRSRKKDIFEKPKQPNFNPFINFRKMLRSHCPSQVIKRRQEETGDEFEVGRSGRKRKRANYNKENEADVSLDDLR